MEDKTNIVDPLSSLFGSTAADSGEKKSPGFLKKVQSFFSQNTGASLDKNVGVVLHEEDVICAKIATESYKSPQQRLEVIDAYVLDKKYASPTYCVYLHEKKHHCVIGYRGTVVTDLKDIASDAQIILDIQGVDPRVKEALDVYDALRRTYEGYHIWICGHSLGGTLSYIVAKHRIPERCVVFNPGVSLNTFFIQMLQDTLVHSHRTQNTYTYKIFGDIISTLAFVGHTKTFTLKLKDPLQLHALQNFLV